jgi:hypothetical protein
MGALMALDRLVVATGLLVLLGGTGFVAVARLATPAWRLNQRLERRAWRLLEVAWWVTLLGTLAGLLLHGPFSTGLLPILTLDCPAIFASNLPHTRAPPTPEPTLTKYERRSRSCCSLNARTRPGRHGFKPPLRAVRRPD